MANIEPLDIRLKLLSENNVILAKSDGLQTEVFMPVVIDGRISIINVIPQRRCSCIATTHLVAKKKQLGQPIGSPSDTLNNWHVSLSSTLPPQKKKSRQTSEPLANSTPSQIKSSLIRQNNANQKVSSRSVLDKTTNLTCLTPESMRRAVAEVNNTFLTAPIARPINKALQFSDCHNNEPVLARQSVIPASPCPSVAHSDAPTDNLSEIAWPKTPPPLRKANTVDNTIEIPSPDKLQWRKVLTPVRTYARQNHALNTTYRPLFNAVPQHYLENPTQPPKSMHTSKKKWLKVVIDKETSISASSFKQQLKSESAIILHEKYHKDLKKLDASVSRKIAFDLLTNPTARSSCIAKKLQNQFHQRCVNKGSSTYPKYKKLCATTPLDVQPSCTPRILNPLVEIKANNISNCRVTPAIASKPGDRTDVYQLKSTSTLAQAQMAVPITTSNLNNMPSRMPFTYKIISDPTATTTSIVELEETSIPHS